MSFVAYTTSQRYVVFSGGAELWATGAFREIALPVCRAASSGVSSWPRLISGQGQVGTDKDFGAELEVGWLEGLDEELVG